MTRQRLILIMGVALFLAAHGNFFFFVDSTPSAAGTLVALVLGAYVMIRAAMDM